MTTPIYRDLATVQTVFPHIGMELDAHSRDLIGGAAGPLDTPFAVTLFKDQFAGRKDEKCVSLIELAILINGTRARDKKALPWLKLARFGTERSDKGSLRHGGNVLASAGVEIDYDGGPLAPDEAANRLAGWGIAALIYTTPSHGLPGKGSRWRALFPFSRELPPGERRKLVTWALGALGTAEHVDPASFAISTAFYFGGTDAAPRTWLIDGRFLDQRDELRFLAIGERVEREQDSEPCGLPLDVIRDAVMAIPNDDRPYDEWLGVLASIHVELGEDGRELAHAWSEQSGKYNPDDLNRRWESFGSYSGPKRTGASILREARKHGWREPPELTLTDDDVSLDGWRKTAPTRSGRLTFTRPDECAAMPVGDYVWKGVLAPGDLACIVGAPGAGKSLLAPYLGYMAALGAPAFGKRTKRTGPVFYVAAEDEAGMRARVAALRYRHGSTDGFVVIGGVGDLFREKAPDLAALRAAVAEQRPSLIIIDTLAQAFPGLEENETKSMAHVVNVGRSLAEHGAAVVLVHHTTKDGGSLPRGSGVLNGALDASILVEAEGGVISGRLTKNRRGPAGPLLAFKIGTRAVGKDVDGETVTVAYAEPVDAEPKGRTATKAGRAALAVLMRLGGPSRKPVKEDQWRKACAEDRAVTAAEKPDDRRKVVTRIFQGLVRDGFLTIREGMVSLASIPEVEDELSDDDVRDIGQTGQNRTMSGPIPPAKRPDDRTDRTRAFRPGPVSGSAMPNNRVLNMVGLQ